MEKAKALCSKIRTQLDSHKGVEMIEMFELLELIVEHLSKPKTINFNIDTLVKEVNMAVPTTKKAEKELSKTINDRLVEVLKDQTHISQGNVYTETDMIDFATYIYYHDNELPQLKPDIKSLKQWEGQKRRR